MSERSKTVAEAGSTEIVVKKSRFICHLKRVTDPNDARTFVDECKKQWWDANHNCSAWVIGERAQLQRSSDDGEPSGTAGIPILNALNQRELTDTVAVVTRYFGGTLLGAGGLIRAYGGAVTAGLDETGIIQRKPLQIVQTTANYDHAGKIEFALRGSPYHLEIIDYGSDVTFTLHLEPAERAQFDEWLAEISGGSCTSTDRGIHILEVPV